MLTIWEFEKLPASKGVEAELAGSHHGDLGNWVVPTLPAGSAAEGEGCALRTEEPIGQIDNFVSVWALVVLWTLEADGLVPKRVSAWWASLNYGLVSEGTEKAWGAVETFS